MSRGWRLAIWSRLRCVVGRRGLYLKSKFLENIMQRCLSCAWLNSESLTKTLRRSAWGSSQKLFIVERRGNICVVYYWRERNERSVWLQTYNHLLAAGALSLELVPYESFAALKSLRFDASRATLTDNSVVMTPLWLTVDMCARSEDQNGLVVTVREALGCLRKNWLAWGKPKRS